MHARIFSWRMPSYGTDAVGGYWCGWWGDNIAFHNGTNRGSTAD
jgi:hypothetical protein